MNSTESAVRYLRPAATIIENPEGFVIEADMPGVTREGLKLTVDKGVLTILGKRNAVNATGARRIHQETSGLDYRRVFELGREINRNGVVANFALGVLRVFLPKVAEVQPRRVEVAG